MTCTLFLPLKNWTLPSCHLTCGRTRITFFSQSTGPVFEIGSMLGTQILLEPPICVIISHGASDIQVSVPAQDSLGRPKRFGITPFWPCWCPRSNSEPPLTFLLEKRWRKTPVPSSFSGSLPWLLPLVTQLGPLSLQLCSRSC